jgi:orotate phosphoribosyltransferase
VTPEDLLDALERSGALRRGHFSLTSGRHSDVFVQKFRLFEDPELTRRCGAALASLWPEGFDVVASPAVGAVLLGFTTALAAGARNIFAERVEGALRFRRGFSLEPGERVLVVEDVVTTGGSAGEVLGLAMRSGARPVGVGVLVDRRGQAAGAPIATGAHENVELRALLTLDAPSWDPKSCRLCRAGVPLEEPGSRALAAAPAHPRSRQGPG